MKFKCVAEEYREEAVKDKENPFQQNPVLKKDTKIPPLEPEMSSQESSIFIGKNKKRSMTSQLLFNQSHSFTDTSKPLSWYQQRNSFPGLKRHI